MWTEHTIKLQKYFKMYFEGKLVIFVIGHVHNYVRVYSYNRPQLDRCSGKMYKWALLLILTVIPCGFSWQHSQRQNSYAFCILIFFNTNWKNGHMTSMLNGTTASGFRKTHIFFIKRISFWEKNKSNCPFA